MQDYDNQYEYSENKQETPDGLKDENHTDPKYLKKSEKQKVKDYEKQDYI